MEKITILGITQIPTMVYGKDYFPDYLMGESFVMMIRSDYDNLEREVFMGFGPDGKGIYANDYKNNVIFKFVDRKIDISQCEIGRAYNVKADKMQCSEMVASIRVLPKLH